MDVLRGYLASRTVLLVLDNLEQLSRRPPRSWPTRPRGGHRPRPHLDLNRRINGEQAPGPTLSASEAQTLFLDRARLARSDFVATGDEAAASPASWTDCRSPSSRRGTGRVFLPTRILERLAFARPHHRRTRRPGTQRMPAGRSAGLTLAPAEQTLFRRLAVLVGDWTMEWRRASPTPTGRSGWTRSTASPRSARVSLLRIVPRPRSLFGRHAFEYAGERLDASGERPSSAYRHATVFRDSRRPPGRLIGRGRALLEVVDY
jgi:hypothetical protein